MKDKNTRKPVVEGQHPTAEGFQRKTQNSIEERQVTSKGSRITSGFSPVMVEVRRQ